MRHLRVLEVDHVCGVGHFLVFIAMGLFLGSWRETHGHYELCISDLARIGQFFNFLVFIFYFSVIF